MASDERTEKRERRGRKRKRKKERASRPQGTDVGSTGSPLRQNESFMPRALAFTTSSRTNSSLFLFLSLSVSLLQFRLESGPDGERLTRSALAAFIYARVRKVCISTEDVTFLV